MGTLHQIDPMETTQSALFYRNDKKSENNLIENAVKVSNNLPVDYTSTNLKTNQPFSKSYDPYVN